MRTACILLFAIGFLAYVTHALGDGYTQARSLMRRASLPKAVNGKTVVLQDANNFGFFMPPKPKQNVAEHEVDGIAFMTAKNTAAPGATILPQGFIKSKFFVKNTRRNFVQVTGKFDNTMYVNSADEGGQYDHNHAPKGGSCAGFRFFVNLVEPNEGRYCIRCCTVKKDCPTGRSEKGCLDVIGGRY